MRLNSTSALPHWVRRRRWAAAIPVFLAAALVAVAGTTAYAQPAGSAAVRPATPMMPFGPYTVTLNPTTTNLWLDEATTLNAAANAVPQADAIFVYESVPFNGTPQLVSNCFKGKTACQVGPLTGTVLGATFTAYIASADGNPPLNVLAQSADVNLAWKDPGPIGLNATASTLAVGGTSDLTATAGVNLSQTPYHLQIWNTTTSPATLVAGGDCTSGTTCPNPGNTVAVSQNAWTIQTYVATLALDGGATTYPPAKLVETSPTSYITWNGLGYGISLSASSSSPYVTATAVNIDIANSPYYSIYIYREDTGQVVASTGTSNTCTYYITQTGIPLIAFVAEDTGSPPVGIVASSNAVASLYSNPT